MSENNNLYSLLQKDLENVFSNSSSTEDEDPSVWFKSIRDKLYSMFCSPMKEEYTHEAFKWTSHLCMSIGDFSWISTGQEWTKEEAKIFSCIARLSINEVHILLPLIQRHLTEGDDPEIEDGKLMTRSAKQDDYDRFGDHLTILESVIKSLVKGQGIDDDNDDTKHLANALSGDVLKSLLERLKEVMNSTCDYLELVHRHWKSLIDSMEGDKFSSAEGALRIICVWLSEDSESFKPQCKRFLIELIINNLLLSDRPTKNDLLILALHSICTDDEEMLNRLRQLHDYEKALDKYLSYVQKEHDNSIDDKRSKKMLKLRCGLVKDLITRTKKSHT